MRTCEGLLGARYPWTQDAKARDGHYRADGNGVVPFEGGRHPRTWLVAGNDLVCVNALAGPACYRLRRHMTKPATYRSQNLANDPIVEFVVEHGVLRF